RVLQALPGAQRIEDAKLDLVRVEMMGAHEIEIAARPRATRRIGVAPAGVRLTPGLGRPGREALAVTSPVGFEQPLEALLEERIDFLLERFRARTNVAIADRDPLRADDLGLFADQNLHVHDSVSAMRE